MKFRSRDITPEQHARNNEVFDANLGKIATAYGVTMTGGFFVVEKILQTHWNTIEKVAASIPPGGLAALGAFTMALVLEGPVPTDRPSQEQIPQSEPD